MVTESSIAPRRRNTIERRERRQALGFITPAVLGLAVFTVLPVGLAIVMSLFDWPIFGKRAFVGFDNYVTLLTSSPDFWPALRNSAVFTLLYVPLNLVVALGLSLLLGPRIRGRAVFRVLFFIPVVTPIVASALIWRLVLQPDGLLNGMTVSLFGWELPNFLVDQNWAMLAVVAMSVWAGMGYNMLVLTAALEQVPTSVVEAAQIDGARGIRLVWQVIIPLISPAIFFAAVMTIISSMQVFAQPQLLTGGGPGTSTVPLVMFIYNTGFKFQDLGLAAAGAWILFVIIIGITALQFRAQKRWVHYEH
ncbi:carbohydrate ABC transporter permease [Microbacterium testaceum]|uniref:ABC transporter substrate-binding protein n=1 Tax=Microbacterium testaceum TaxID=2033 RepID=A0A147F524_MICTE|nr:sugar ABC transporter permease [Microbacterium testaceum]KTS03669.1 ABC transporter substrate-binding protein [Microbacterium testaceum]KTS09359.1 ABC transporter substrate-binding protein [Microbacterium testaceum]KTS62361.1 ABC transporter substrate-binding protein [Microbacterium testaceum]KTS90494.1 ABC transporter substrate-binding protein [Microbacterium testaceum]